MLRVLKDEGQLLQSKKGALAKLNIFFYKISA